MAKQKRKSGPKKKPLALKKSKISIFVENGEIETNGGVEVCQDECKKFLTSRAQKLAASSSKTSSKTKK